MLTAAQIAYLATPEGAAVLAEAATVDRDPLKRLTALRRAHSPEIAAAVVATLDLRARAAAKFADADSMFFTREGLEQATSDEVAAWRAARFPEGAAILDLCCGIGGDALALARRGRVLAYDRDEVALACARANAAALGLADRIAIEQADVTALPLDADAAFIDPSRRPGGKRVRASEQYSPPLSFAIELARALPNVAVKVSPAIDDEALKPLGARAEFVSHRGECKECVLWFGEFGPAAERSAAVLPAGAVLTATEPDGTQAPLGPLRDWLIEPDPAVIRAHLLPELCRLLDAAALAPMTAYLASDAEPRTPYADAYRVVDALPMSLSKLQRRLRELDRRVVAVKKRGMPHDVEDLGRRLPAAGTLPTVVVLARIGAEPMAILCDPAGTCGPASE